MKLITLGLPVLLLGKVAVADSFKVVKQDICNGLLDNAKQVTQEFQQIPADCFTSTKANPAACQETLSSIYQQTRLIRNFSQKCANEGGLSVEQAQGVVDALPNKQIQQKVNPKHAFSHTVKPVKIHRNDADAVKPLNQTQLWFGVAQ